MADEETNIERAAKTMIQVYGDKARAQALSELKKMANRGDLSGEAVWQKIADAIEVRQSSKSR